MNKRSMVLASFIGVVLVAGSVLYLTRESSHGEIPSVMHPSARTVKRPVATVQRGAPAAGAVDDVRAPDERELLSLPYTEEKYSLIRKRYRSRSGVAYGPLDGAHLKYFEQQMQDLSAEQPLPQVFRDVINGQVDTLKTALASGTYPDQSISRRDPLGLSETLLDVAISAGQRDVISLLLESGADPNSRPITHPVVPGVEPTRIAPFVYEVPLKVAAGKGEDDVVQLLLQHGANIEEAGHVRGPEGCTALCAAATAAETSTAYLLLMAGASIKPLLDSNGILRLQFAAPGSSDRNRIAIREMLVARGVPLPHDPISDAIRRNATTKMPRAAH